MPVIVPPYAPQGQEDPMIIAPAPRSLDYPKDDEFGKISPQGPTIAAPGRDIQQVGFLTGIKPFLNSKLAPTVSDGAARPLAPGEYIQLEPGKSDSWASEMTTTVQRQDGAWLNIPMLWIKDGKPYVAATPEEALDLAEASGLNWNSFTTQREANDASESREAAWQKMTDPATEAAKVAPLWATAQQQGSSGQKAVRGAGAPVPHIYLPDVNVNPDPLKGAPGINLPSRQ